VWGGDKRGQTFLEIVKVSDKDQAKKRGQKGGVDTKGLRMDQIKGRTREEGCVHKTGGGGRRKRKRGKTHQIAHDRIETVRIQSVGSFRMLNTQRTPLTIKKEETGGAVSKQTRTVRSSS